MQTDFEIQCPFCGEFIWLEFFPQDGRHQEMVIDCEVCCNPIQASIHFDSEGDGMVMIDRAQ